MNPRRDQPACPGPVPQDLRRRLLHDGRHDRRRRREDPGAAARLPARSGERQAAARRLPAGQAGFDHHHRRAGAVHQRSPGAGRQARRRDQRRAPPRVADLPGRLDPREGRRRPDRPRHQRLAAHLLRSPCPKACARAIKRDFTIATVAAPAGVKEELRAAAEAAARPPTPLPSPPRVPLQHRPLGCRSGRRQE